MDCLMDEYYHGGQCHKCSQCPPGQELKEVRENAMLGVSKQEKCPVVYPKFEDYCKAYEIYEKSIT